MDDLFDVADNVTNLCAAAGDEDNMLSDFESGAEMPMRSRAYTWPTRPLTDERTEFGPPSSCGSEASPGVTGVSGPQLLASEDGERGSRGELTLSPGGVSSTRKVTSRRNAWGNLSYADLITRAIESSPDKRLTLSQIYAWMVANVPFFSDKGDSNSSAGWKNSIRHNLSLHSRFVRVQNEGTGKSSWWMVNPEAAMRAPRKRAGTMDSATGIRRPSKPLKRPPGGLKHARSTELHASGNNLFDPNVARGSPTILSGDMPGFESPRRRAASGNSSNSGCSPGPALATPQDTDITPCFTLPPSTWEVLYPPKQETLSENLADIFISDAVSRPMVDNVSAPQPSRVYSDRCALQQATVFMPNEAYAHGIPVHQSGLPTYPAQMDMPPSCGGMVSGMGYSAAATSSMPPLYQSSAGLQLGCNGGPPTVKQEHVPTLGELLQDQQTSGGGYHLNTFLTSGGSMTSQEQPAAQQQQKMNSWPAAGGDVGTVPQRGVAATTAATGSSMTTPLRRPLHVNQRLLMQLLATKPHLARRLQQLIEAKRRQLGAMQQQVTASPVFPLSPSQQLPSQPVHAVQALRSPGTGTMLQQLLTSGSAQSPLSIADATPQGSTVTDMDDFPPDLDLSLLDLNSTSDIDCDIEQVISHELSFGDELDFSFDQLQLDEFDVSFGS